MFLGQSLAFWVAIIGAIVVKLLTSPYHSLLRAVSTVFAALFAAYIFTDAAVDWIGLDPEKYTVPMAALLALTGEGLMRMVVKITSDYKEILNIIREWRGRRDD